MLRLAVRVRREHAELALAELLELAPAGVEEVDLDAETVEYAIYGAPGELPELGLVQARAGAALVEVVTTEIADDWAERWRQFHRPLVLGERLSVRPPWLPAQGTEVEVVIDPGRAFGTGAHPTTRLCLELLLELPVPGGPVGSGGADAVALGEKCALRAHFSPSATGLLTAGPAVVDLGCGSGVLAIAAAKLGWGPVLALDSDQLAIDATLANAAVNAVSDRIETRRFDLRHDDVPGCRLALANLLGPLLLQWCARMAASDRKRPRRIIVSGLLVSEIDAIAQAFASISLPERDRRIHGDWAALLLDGASRG